MMKSILRVVCVSIIAFLAAFNASSATIDVTVGDFTYNLQYPTAVLTGHNNPNLRGLTIPTEISYNGTRYTVVGIGESAFSGCSYLTGSLKIPETVTSIGDKAFYNCSGFTGPLIIGNSVTSIGNDAFYHCRSFTGPLTIPSSVISIGNNAFDGCWNFTGPLTIPESVKSIGNCAFLNCCNLTGPLVIPESVISIGGFAFSFCDGLTGSLTIPNSVTEIGGNAFRGCSGFTGTLTIGNSVISIGDGAFDGCSGLTGPLAIPNSVVRIGKNAFYDCSGFTGSLTIGNSVERIGENAFYDCSGFIGSLTIPESVISIGDKAFYNCSGFTGSLTIGGSVETIGKNAFYDCGGFTGSLTIGKSVTSIDDSAFKGCDNFESIKSLNPEPPLFLSTSLPSNTDIIIRVPAGSGATYRCSSGWLRYSNIYEIGDVDHSEKITVSDAVSDANYIIGIEQAGTFDEICGDMNLDGRVSLIDVSQIIDAISEYNPDDMDAIAGVRSVVPAMTNGELKVLPANNGINGKLSAFGRKESYGNGMLLTGKAQNAGVSEGEPQFQVGDVVIELEEVATLPIILHCTNNSDVRGFQAKVILPEGLEFVKDTGGYAVLGDDYSSGYQITSNAIGTTLSILGFGTKPENPFKEGILCYFKVKAATDFKGGKINVSEAFITFDNQEIACSTQSGEVILAIPATSISLNLNRANLKVAETLQLEATVLPATTTDKIVIWSSSDDRIASVDTNGLVIANKEGTAEIIAKAGSKEANITITVIPTIAESLALTNTGVNMQAGDTFQLTALFTPATTTDKTLKWVSSNPSIVSVDHNGILTAHALGEVTVSASTTDGSNLTASCRVLVNPTPVEKISIVYDGPTTIKVGDVIRLGVEIKPESATDKSLNWMVQIAEVLNVTQEGLLTAVGPGEAWVGVETTDGAFAYLMFTVEPVKVERIEIEPVMSSLKIGETVQLTATVSPSNATNQHITWDSNDTDIASVDENGLVTAIGVGATDINARATDGSGEIQAVRINVVSIPVYIESITIPSEITVEKGTQYEFNPEIAPDNASDKQLVWESSDPSLGSFDGNVFYAHARGEVIATCRAVDGSDVFAQCHIRIETYAKSLTLNEHDLNLDEGLTFQLVATIEPVDAVDSGSVVWESSNEQCVSVDAQGMISALSGGEATITASTQYYPWATDECRVIVSMKTGIESISIDDVAIHIENGNIIINGLTQNSIVRLTDMDGIVLNQQRCIDQALNIKAPSTGVYILSVGKHSFKIIIR